MLEAQVGELIFEDFHSRLVLSWALFVRLRPDYNPERSPKKEQILLPKLLDFYVFQGPLHVKCRVDDLIFHKAPRQLIYQIEEHFDKSFE